MCSLNEEKGVFILCFFFNFLQSQFTTEANFHLWDEDSNTLQYFVCAKKKIFKEQR